MMKYETKSDQTRIFNPTILKALIGFGVVLLVRLIPFRMPNIDPIIGTLMPLSTRFTWFDSFVFAFMSIAIYDLFTSGIGMWTWVTALTYGAVGLGARWYFKDRVPRVVDYLKFGLLGTLFYDAVTMMIGPVLYAQPLTQALVGQIPFTLSHLLGTAIFAVVLSPALYRWVAQNERLELPYLWKKLTMARS